jgi:hypothetical protein
VCISARFLIPLLSLLTMPALLACSASTSPAPAKDTSDLRVLFVGNSLTSANDLPAVVARIGQADGRAVHVTSAAIDNTALVDHLTQGTALARIAAGGWSMVLLQQGPTPAGICRDTLVLATRALDARIRAAGGQTAVLMPWPYDGFPEAYQWVHESARVAADAVGGRFVPAGDAWAMVRRTDPAVRLYGADGYHPTALGSLLTALVIYESLTGRDVRALELSQAISPAADAYTAALLQRAAHDAVRDVVRDAATRSTTTADPLRAPVQGSSSMTVPTRSAQGASTC